jgi:hypothetical protein
MMSDSPPQRRRYCLDLPFPPRRYDPASDPAHLRPELAFNEEWKRQEESLMTTKGFCWGTDLFNHGYYWEAHEVWEQLWKQAEKGSAEHLLLQGFIQCAAACLKISSRQEAPAQRLVERGLAKLEELRMHSSVYDTLKLAGFACQMRDYREGRSKMPPRLDLDGFNSQDQPAIFHCTRSLS